MVRFRVILDYNCTRLGAIGIDILIHKESNENEY